MRSHKSQEIIKMVGHSNRTIPKITKVLDSVLSLKMKLQKKSPTN